MYNDKTKLVGYMLIDKLKIITFKSSLLLLLSILILDLFIFSYGIKTMGGGVVYLSVVVMCIYTGLLFLALKYISKNKSLLRQQYIYLLMALVICAAAGVAVLFSPIPLYLSTPLLYGIVTYTMASIFIENLNKNIKFIVAMQIILFIIGLLWFREKHTIVSFYFMYTYFALISSIAIISLFKIDFNIQLIKKDHKITAFYILSLLTLLLGFPVFVTAGLLIVMFILYAKDIFKLILHHKAISLATVGFVCVALFTDKNITYSDIFLLFQLILLLALLTYTILFTYKNINNLKPTNDIYPRLLIYTALIIIFHFLVLKSSDDIEKNINNLDNKMKNINSLQSDYNYIKKYNIVNISTVRRLDEVVTNMTKNTKNYYVPYDYKLFNIIRNIAVPSDDRKPLPKTSKNSIIQKKYDKLIVQIKKLIIQTINKDLENYLNNSDDYILSMNDLNIYAQQCNMKSRPQFSCIAYKTILESRLKKVNRLDVADFVQIGGTSLKQGSTTTATSSKLPPKYELKGDTLYKTTRTQKRYSSKIDRYAYVHIPIKNNFCSDVNVKIKAKFTFNPFEPDKNDNGFDSFTGALGGLFEVVFRSAVADTYGYTQKEAFKDFGVKYASNSIDIKSGETKVLTITLDTDGIIRDSIEMKKSAIHKIQIIPSYSNCDRGKLIKKRIDEIDRKIDI